MAISNEAAIPYIRELKEFMRALSPIQRLEMLKDPVLMAKTLTPVLSGIMTEGRDKDTLLREQGIK